MKTAYVETKWWAWLCKHREQLICVVWYYRAQGVRKVVMR